MDKDYEQNYFKIEKIHWWFKGRRDLIKKIKISKDAKILEVGCGSGQNLLLWKDQNPKGLDISQEAVDEAKNIGIDVIKGDLNKKLPFKKESFDVIFALDVIEHLESDIQATKKLVDLLKPNGRLIINVPAFQFLWSFHDVQNMHKKRYTAKEIKKLAKNSGLRELSSTYWNFSLFFPAFLRVKIHNILNQKESSIQETSPILNKIFFNLLKVENILISKKIKFSLGTSFFYIGIKK
jgi:SAM-dependent methyltransferase